MPQVLDRGDGSQDALVVRVRGGGLVGWGECEAAPLVSIASWCCPMSHSACRPLRDSVLGRRLESPRDIEEIGRDVRRRSFDLLQTDHTLSGIDIALWDILGKRLGEPVWRLLGQERTLPKTPYASALFGDDPQATLEKARRWREAGYRAVKLGWGPYGSGTVEADAEQVRAAREGLGEDGVLLVDAGTVWREDVDAASARLPALEECGALWLEEPFVKGALGAYRELARRCRGVKLAGGEGIHDEHGARLFIELSGAGYVQIDAGRVGGITVARKAALHAAARGMQFVNHTFTTQLALSASLQAYAGMAGHDLCEHPVETSSLARELAPALGRNPDGDVIVPQAPGLGVEPDVQAMRRYLVDAEIGVGGRVLYRTPEL